MSRFRYVPNFHSPNAHSHRVQEEAHVVVAGPGRILLDDEVQDPRAVGLSSGSHRSRARVHVGYESVTSKGQRCGHCLTRAILLGSAQPVHRGEDLAKPAGREPMRERPAPDPGL